MQVTVKNAGLIEKQLLLFPEKAEKVFSQAVQRSAEALRDDVKKLPPVSAKTTGYGAKGIPVDTGFLRQSIRKKNINKLAAGVSPKARYGAPVHDGTKHMQARPFFEWALELGSQEKIDNIFDRYAKMIP